MYLQVMFLFGTENRNLIMFLPGNIILYKGEKCVKFPISFISVVKGNTIQSRVNHVDPLRRISFGRFNEHSRANTERD